MQPRYLVGLFLSTVAVAGTLIEPGASLELMSSEFELADGPSWVGSTLIIPDVKGEKILKFNPKSRSLAEFAPQSGRISATFHNNGILFLSDNANGRIAHVNSSNEIVPLSVINPHTDPTARPNDLVVDDQGGIYYTLTRQGQVIYIDPHSKQQRPLIENVITPNGIILSPDQKTLYVSAASTKKIWAYPLTAPGVAGPGLLFAAMDTGPEKAADGMTIDRLGNVYCAGPSDIWIWNPSGTLVDKIAVPTRPINCAFGDSDLRSLYITGFGGLYRLRMKTYGIAENPPFDASLQWNESARPSTEIPQSIQSRLNVVYSKVGDRKLLCDIFRPQSVPGPLPAIIVVHGGGWLNGSKNKFRALAIELAKRGFVTIAIEYRLGHEARFPAGIKDCNAATEFIRTNAGLFGIDPQRIGAVGGSAGGHLVGLMATGWENPATHRDPGLDIAATRLDVAIVMGGPMQTTTGSVAERSRNPESGSNSNIWLGATVDEDPERYALADPHLQIDENDPPIYFLEGEHDSPERNQASRDRLRALGIATGLHVYKDGKHGCWNHHPWFTPMIDDMVAIFNRHLARE